MKFNNLRLLVKDFDTCFRFYSEKAVIVIQVEDVDAMFRELTSRGVEFVSEPADMAGWGGRVAHFRDPEENLIELYSGLSKDKWSDDLIDESKEYET